MRASIWVALACLLAGPLPAQAVTPLIPCKSAGDGSLAQQRAMAAAALAPVEAAQTARLEALGADEGDRMDDAIQTYRRERAAALTPLAVAGNADALHRMAADLRDETDPDLVRNWYAWTSCAAGHDHPIAHDELVRWFWHQKGDGSMTAIQASRATALDHAWKAASAAGNAFGLARIAAYISGDLHQYPASLTLGRRLNELCARADEAGCQQNLVRRTPYDYGLDALDEAFWLDRLAARSPASFAAPRDAALAALSPEDRETARRRLADWRPLTPAQMEAEWREIREAILAHGAASPGAPTDCTTSMPWCRGSALRPD